MDSNFYLGFSLAPGIGPKRFQNSLRVFGSVEQAWSGSREEFRKVGIAGTNFSRFDEFRQAFNINEYLERLRKSRVEFIPYGAKYYPEGLTKLDDPPIGLFAKGNQKLLFETKKIAVVGARKITTYGEQITSFLVGELCSAGFVIVSGMALGIDGTAHKSAIKNKGLTIAVLGCGVDCPYPRENERLYEEILDSNGLIISEYPLGMPANKGTFPARNRIIAGVSLAVLITEAAEDSGSLITADHAVKQGKKVFAVPGPITSQMSRGSIKLLKQGASLVSSVSDILENLHIISPPSHSRRGLEKNYRLSEEAKKVLESLENEERTIDEIAKLTKIPVSKLSIILSGMELSGLVRNIGGKLSLTQTA